MTDVFPFNPNWSTAPEVTLSHKTDTFTARSGKEQRRALRSTPRRTVDFTSLAHKDDMVAFTRLMALKQNADFTFPDWTRDVRTYGVANGADHFTIRVLAPEWLAAGKTVFLIDGDTTECVIIATVTGYTVSLTAPVTREFAVGTQIRPALEGLVGSTQASVNTSNTITVKVSLDVKPGSVPNSDQAFFPYVVGGREVFPFRWNWDEEVSAQFNWQIEQVDFGRGITLNHRPVDFGSTTQRVTTLQTGTRNVDRLTQFLERQKGQRGEFWMPSGTDDMTLASTALGGTSSFTVTGSDVFDTFSGSEVYSGVAFYLRDGRTICRKISNIILVSGDSHVSVSQPFTSDIAPSNVAKVCWMRPARLSSDDATIEYLTDSTTQWQATTVSVTYSADSMNYADLDGAGVWAMDEWGDSAEDIMGEIAYMMNIASLYGDVRLYDLAGFDDAINSELWEALG